MGTHRQIGVVGCASVAEYDADLIKKHEKTRADKEDDRTRHIEELRAHDEPVFLTYRADPAIDRLVAEALGAPPVYDFTTADGVQHQLWVLGREATAALAASASSRCPPSTSPTGTTAAPRRRASTRSSRATAATTARSWPSSSPTIR